MVPSVQGLASLIRPKAALKEIYPTVEDLSMASTGRCYVCWFSDLSDLLNVNHVISSFASDLFISSSAR